MTRKPIYLFSLIASAALVLSVSAIVIMLASGYRFDLETRSIQGTGVIVVNSIPDGALVYINDVPKDASNTSITNLKPATYKIKLEKQGYASWSEDIVVKAELVTKIEALLIPLYPSLQPLTFTGASNPLISPDEQKIAYSVKDGSSAGIWLLDLTERPFNLSQKPRLLLADQLGKKYSTATLTWSPESTELLITFGEGANKTHEAYTLSNNTTRLVSNYKDYILDWEQTSLARETEQFASIDVAQAELIHALTEVSWSPDNQYILYTEQVDNLVNYRILPVKSKTTEVTNLPTPTGQAIFDSPIISLARNIAQKVTWYPDSNHLLIVTGSDESATIEIVEINGSNRTKVFSGIIKELLAVPNPTGTKITILTTFNAGTESFNLYSVNLRS